jgi:hypothetical protein
MNIKKNILFIVAMMLSLCIFVTNSNAALYSDAQLGVRASAMGGAFVSVARNADAVYWNQAALAIAENHNLMFMYSDIYNVGIDESYLSYSQKFSDKFGFGVNWLRHSADLEEKLISQKNKWTDDVYSLAIGTKIMDNLYAGLAYKKFKIDAERSDMGDITSSGTGFDVSLLYKMKENGLIPALDLGFQVRNFASDMSGDNIDATYKLGVSGYVIEDLLVALEFDYENETTDGDYELKYSLGAEYNLMKSLAIRIGTNDGSFTTGFGVVLKNKICLDYSFEKDLGDVDDDNHRFSIGFTF